MREFIDNLPAHGAEMELQLGVKVKIPLASLPGRRIVESRRVKVDIPDQANARSVNNYLCYT